ncbi:Uncharacterised protein [Mycobacterium tuberculosis]|uniref:Uncharacterized protein n=1 Tax=Mycobacterium tuberculosis TaxID=1773 RepID=A0A655JAT2_MYCTX|nr:Uncharacterised protein [Mycobacterium tuberculosis]CNL72743.1 Uncharacterised protein [Mycobacterium tuberculosis]COW64231.1 Uncharacterised protein [Mycobacterium tuberculosis]COX10712.1 Uncharacterised protein [Mycobacterium tuberculosis]
MLGFGFPEIPGRADLGHHLAGPQAGCLDIGDGVQRDPLLLLIEVEDGRPVAGPPVVTLPVFGCRVVDLEEEFQQGAVIGDRGVEDDFDGFGVRAVVTVGCVGDVPAAVAHPRGDHTGLVADQILQPPKAAAGEDRFLIARHFRTSRSGYTPAMECNGAKTAL